MSAAAAPFTWELPADARIVALVSERSEAGRSATVVDAIATSIARRRGRTLVLNSESAPSPLDELAGAPEQAESRGMAEFLAGQTRLARVAVRRADCPYIYLPAGQVPEGVVGLLESPALARFVSRVKEEDGTLFIVMSERGQPSPGLLDLIDGYIAMGSVPPEDHGMPCYGHVPFESSVAPTPALEPAPEPASEPEPEPEAVEDPAEFQPDPAPTPAIEPESEPAAAPTDSPPAPGRARGRRPRGPLVAALVIAALAVGNWWAYRNGWFDNAISRVGSMIAARNEAPAAAPAEVPAAEVPAAEATPVGDDPAAQDPAAPTDLPEGAALTDPPEITAPASIPPPPDESAVAAAFESAAERPYSVLLGSFSDPAEAAGRVAEIRTLHGGVLYFMAPTTIREVRYQRILAGAVASESEASALMDELAAVGVAEEANAWLLRPVRLAYDLGVFADRGEMEARIAELASLGIPAYSLETALDDMPVFRVYGGAYENEEAAAPMSDALDAAGESATLVVRRGATPSTP